MRWQPHAEKLAIEVTRKGSRWRIPIATIPRHLFVPRWWNCTFTDDWTPRDWRLCDGPSNQEEWLKAAYANKTLVTQVGALHADHARPGDRPIGLPTSSATLPSLVLRMFGYAQLHEDADILDVGVGSGYSAALLTRQFGDHCITSIDVDPYLTKAAMERLDSVGLHPKVITCDATGPLPGVYDRIVAMVSVRPIPASWLDALRPGGRLVTTIARTSIVITANKTEEPSGEAIQGEPVVAVGQVEHGYAGFMSSRSGPDYPPALGHMFAAVRDQKGEHIGQGQYPVCRVDDSGELDSVLEVIAPGIEHHYEATADGRRTAWMLHHDGSWARATAMRDERPIVHQSGPRRLWDIFDDIRHYWLTHGYLQLYGANALITSTGKIHLARGDWRATIA